ncbi:MAG TPA: tetratricopeptide repeat protein [Chloroflexota bacterium]
MTAPARNAPCSCGSGKKYKLCCLGNAASPTQIDPSTLVNSAAARYQRGDLTGAEVACRQALTSNPRADQALHLLAVIARDRRDYPAAAALASEAMEYRGSTPEYLNTLGNALLGLRAFEDALTAFHEALRLRPAFAEARNNLANTLAALGRHAEAVPHFQQALVLTPRNALIHANLGFSYSALGRYVDTVAACRTALRLDPQLAEVCCTLGDAYYALTLHEEAAAALTRAIRLRPGFAHAFNTLGNAYRAMKRYPEASAAYEQAIIAAPDRVEYHANAGKAALDRGHADLALAACAAAIRCDPSYLPALEGIFHVGRLHCAWDGIEQAATSYRKAILACLERNERVDVDPFDAFALHLPPAEQRRLIERLGAQIAAPVAAMKGELPPAPFRIPGQRLRLGYLSSDYRSHATAHLLGHLFTLHDRSRFEVIAYSTGLNDRGYYRDRLEAEAERFVDVYQWTPLRVASRIRQDGVDILVDLHGHTMGASLPVLALHPSPLQIHFLGYAGTVGKDLVDYSLVDNVVCPSEHEHYYSEKVYRLPDTYQINDRQPIGESKPRSTYGLPSEGFVFCCFNASYKITPEIFASWMRILRRTPGSVLWLYQSNEHMARNLQDEAWRQGIPPERLIFGASVPKDQHLARLQHADLMLDTPIVNAMTTASDALWAGVPVLSILGDSFPDRAGASILTAIGLPELIMPDLGAYEETAVRLAAQPQEMAALKAKLAANRLTTPLFDTEHFVRNLEASYEELWARHVIEDGANLLAVPALTY